MIYFVRHAQSHYNLAEINMQAQLGPNYRETQHYLQEKFSPQYLDVEITDLGVKQAEQARDKMLKEKVDLVIVSPMRRALHTCNIIFEGHPDKPQIIVEPAFRQIMESSNDMGTEIEESKAKYPHFDYSHVKDEPAWYVHTLTPVDKERVLPRIQGLEGQKRKERCIEECTAIMRESWGERTAHPDQEQQLKKRVMPDPKRQREILREVSKGGKRVAVVAHSECIREYAGYKIDNCQVFPMASEQI